MISPSKGEHRQFMTKKNIIYKYHRTFFQNQLDFIFREFFCRDSTSQLKSELIWEENIPDPKIPSAEIVKLIVFSHDTKCG